MASIYSDVLNEEIQQITSLLECVCSALAAESEHLRDNWSEARFHLIDLEKSKYTPNQERRMKTATYSQLNFAARVWGCGMELYWYTANSDHSGKKHFRPIPMGPSCRKTRTHYQPFLRKMAKKWEWELVKNTELQAKNLRKAKGEIVNMRRHMKKLVKLLDKIDVESVKHIHFHDDDTLDVAIKNKDTNRDEYTNPHIAPDPRR